MKRQLLVAVTALCVALPGLSLPTSGALFTTSNTTANSWKTKTQFGIGPISLGAAGSYAVLANTFISSSGATELGADLGISPSSDINGFPPGIVHGTIHVADSAAAQAQTDATKAFDYIHGLFPATEFNGDQIAQVFYPGLYHSAAAFALTGSMTFDAQGAPDSVFIFQIDAAMNTAASSRMLLAGGAQASHIYFEVEGAAGSGAHAIGLGTILARGAVTAGAYSTLQGRLLSRGAATLSSNTVGP